MAGLRITDVRAYPTSFPVDPKDSVTLGIGRAVKRDAVIVKVSTADGVTGWGEAHHGRCPGAVAHLVNTTMKLLVVGQDANDITGVWKRVYDKQLASHGMGAGACLALSGIDMALWDIRGKALRLPLYKLMGGRSKPIPAYAGGVSLGAVFVKSVYDMTKRTYTDPPQAWFGVSPVLWLGLGTFLGGIPVMIWWKSRENTFFVRGRDLVGVPPEGGVLLPPLMAARTPPGTP